MRPAKGYASPKFAFRESESLTGPVVERVGVVLLAAGRGSRFGDESPTTLARLGRRPLVTHAEAAATMSPDSAPARTLGRGELSLGGLGLGEPGVAGFVMQVLSCPAPVRYSITLPGRRRRRQRAGPPAKYLFDYRT